MFLLDMSRESSGLCPRVSEVSLSSLVAFFLLLACERFLRGARGESSESFSTSREKIQVGEGKRVVTCGVLVVAGEHMELLTDLDRTRYDGGLLIYVLVFVFCSIFHVSLAPSHLFTRIREETGCNLDVRRVSPSSFEFEILLYGSPHVRETARVAIELALQCAVEKQFLSKSKGRVGDSVHQAVNEGPRGG